MHIKKSDDSTTNFDFETYACLRHALELMGSALRIARRFARGSLDADKVAVAAGNRERLDTAGAGFSSVIVPPWLRGCRACPWMSRESFLPLFNARDTGLYGDALCGYAR
jgi:hypothetical protein